MTDRERYETLTRHFDSLRFTDEYKISRGNYRFLLTSHNKYLKAKDEIRELKLQVKMLEMGVRS